MEVDAQSQHADAETATASPTSVAPPNERRRPRLNTAALGLGDGERKRGKSMFGVLLNTLNKAKAEDKERNASEAVCLTYKITLEKDNMANNAWLFE